MEVVIALLSAAAQLEPIIATELPTIQALIEGRNVTAAQMASLWNAISQLEAMVAAKAAAIEAAGSKPA